VSNPERVVFPEVGVTKLEVVNYYLAVAAGALRGSGGRANVLVRYNQGIGEAPFWQKRVPEKRPPFVDTVVLRYSSGREAEEVVPRNPATLAWMINLGCLELHPHPARAEDVDHPDELRVDLDPGPGVEWPQIRAVALVARAVLADVGLTGWPKTSGSRGIHVNVRVEPRWSFAEVRRAAFALAREIERRAPDLATSRWWKEERHGVFVDYNQNARDRTVAGAYSVRPRPDARVSAPVTWDELDACDPADFTVRTMPARFAALGDRHEGIDTTPGSLARLLELAEGLEDEEKPPPSGTGRRVPVHPLIEVAKAKRKEDALAGLERWKARHPGAAALLAADDVLVDPMRGRSQSWTRIRVNLRHVPEAERPPQETPDPDYDPSVEWRGKS
jgi:bifunctional non-homologous end joining protein LigD